MDGFIDKLKRHLGLLWVDESEEQTIKEQIEEGLAYLKRFDPSFSYDDPQQAGLLITLVRYIRAGAVDDFEANYKREILALSDRSWEE